jgi:vacuolar-type H+-ATPase subunit D/Vma8
MSHKTSSARKTQQEDLLIAIDQLEQITEVMGEVLNRVKAQVNALDEQHSPVVNNTKIAINKKNKTGQNRKAKKIDLVH